MRRTAALALLSFTALAPAQEKVATVEGVTEYRLANAAFLIAHVLFALQCRPRGPFAHHGGSAEAQAKQFGQGQQQFGGERK